MEDGKWDRSDFTSPVLYVEIVLRVKGRKRKSVRG